MSFIFWPDDRTTEADIGGKALSLFALRNSGLFIPPWFSLLPSAFVASVPEDTWLRLQTEPDSAAMASLLATIGPGPAVAEELRRALDRLCPDGAPVAVRSSGCDEDGQSSSFAGQYDSVVGVSVNQVPDAVASVWRSGFAARVRAYRAQSEATGSRPAPPAVLVQRLVTPSVSGVAFGADPVTGRTDRRIITAVPGFGMGLVAGESDADTWCLEATGTVLTRHISVKPDAWRFREGAVKREPLGEGESTQASLTDAELAQVAAAVETASRHFGHPQDIEWAIEMGSLFLLQSRPITTLPKTPPDHEPFAIWDNSNIVESYSGVTTPLTFSFARRAYEGVYRQFCRILRVPRARLEAYDAVFANMLGLHRGRIYYNLLNWYRVLALLPGFTVNRRFMEQMMGVKEPLPADIVAGLESAGLGARLLDACHLAASMMALIVQQIRLPSTIRRFRARLDDALKAPAVPLESQSAGALAATFLDLENRLLRRWDAPLINDFLTMIWFGVLRDVTSRWSGGEGRLLHNDLLCDTGGLLSAEPARLIEEMAALANRLPDVVDVLSKGTRTAIEVALAQHPDLLASRDAYLDRFGERCFDELKLESPTLLDDPLPLYRAIGRLAHRPPTPPAAPPPSPRHQAEEVMNSALARHPVRRRLFHWILRHARSGVRERENLRLERTRLFGRVRRVFLSLGSRLRELGQLDDPRDVFLLEVDDVLHVVSGAATTLDLRALVALRQNEFSVHRRSPPPPNRFTSRGLPSRSLATLAGTMSRPSQPEEPLDASERRGLGCCPGRVRGRVTVVVDPTSAKVPHGAILVAERTDPGWVLLFPGAAGLLVERGSLLSHSAIVARELGLPTVVSITGLMNWLQDGDEVEFDGATGAVRRLETADTTIIHPPLIPSIPAPA